MENIENNTEKNVSLIAKADENYCRLELAEAFKLYSEAAEMGDAHALYRVGFMHYTGRGVERDLRAAFNCFAKAAEMGDAEAECRLGVCYLRGYGVPEDQMKGLELLYSSLDKDCPAAQRYLGMCYYNGKYVSKDSKYGMALVRKASDRGFPPAMFDMSHFLLNNEADVDGYRELLEKAAEKSHPAALCELGTNLVKGTYCDIDVKKGIEMLKKASEFGLRDADEELGSLYFEGNVVPMDYKLAIPHLLKGAQNGNVHSMFQLGYIFDNDTDSSDSIESAFTWYSEAADRNHPSALYHLGMMYFYGHGAVKDDSRAFECFKSAAEKGNDPAVYFVGMMYAHGLGVTRDFDLAIKWLSKKTISFCAEKDYELSQVYHNIEYIFSNIDDELYYLRRSAKAGYVEAMYTLGVYYAFRKEPSMSDSIYWHIQASNQSHPRSMMIHAEHCLSGAYIPQSTDKALELFEGVYAVNSNPEAAANIAMIYDDPVYGKKNKKEAKRWFQTAAGGNSGYAMYRLSQISREESENSASVYWLRRAAAAEFKVAMVELAEKYENGDGVTKSIEYAVDWYHRAADKGDKEAHKKFKNLLSRIDEKDEEDESEYLRRLAGEKVSTKAMIDLANKAKTRKEKKMWYMFAYNLGDPKAIEWMLENNTAGKKTNKADKKKSETSTKKKAVADTKTLDEFTTVAD